MSGKPKFGMKEICQFLGVSPATIRMYEQFLPNKRYEVLASGHRKFNGSSYMQLYDLRFMTKSGLTVKEAAAACQSDSIKERIDAYTAGRRQLERQLKYLQASLQETEQVLRCLERLKNENARFSIANVPGFYYFECERNGKFLSDPEALETLKEWTAMIPAVYYMNRDVMESPDGKDWSYRIGLAVSDKYSALVPTDRDYIAHHPARTCVVGVIVDENEESLSADDYSYSGKCLSLALDYINERGYKLAGQTFNRYIGSMLSTQDAKGKHVSGGLWYGIYPIE